MLIPIPLFPKKKKMDKKEINFKDPNLDLF